MRVADLSNILKKTLRMLSAWPGQVLFHSCRRRAQKKEPESSSVFVVTFVTHHAEVVFFGPASMESKSFPPLGLLSKSHPDSHAASIVWQEAPMNYGSQTELVSKCIFPISSISGFHSWHIFTGHNSSRVIYKVCSSSHIASHAPWCQSLTRP